MGKHRYTGQSHQYRPTLFREPERYRGRHIAPKAPKKRPVLFVAMLLLYLVVNAFVVPPNQEPPSENTVPADNYIAITAPAYDHYVAEREVQRATRNLLRHEEDKDADEPQKPQSSVQPKKPAPKPKTTTTQKKNTTPKAPNASKAEIAIAYALAQVGKPYVWGTEGPNTFDCSGLTMRAYQQVGIKLPRTTSQQIKVGTRVSRAQLKRGDLVFMSAGHVGIYLGDNKVVHAANPNDDIIVSKLYAFYAGVRVL